MEEDEWYALKKKRAEITLPRVLDTLAVEELEEYRRLLKEEDVRVAAMIEKKKNVKGAAEALFKTEGA